MPSPFRSRVRVGFTVVELLVVLAIIILLVGILLVGLTQAAGSAQAAQTRFLMNSMAAGLVQFKRDHGYLPPVLGDGSQFGGAGTPNNLPGWSRDVILAPAWSPNDPGGPAIAGRQAWFSLTSPAEYLLGYGNRTGDGYGLVGSISDAPVDSPGYFETPTLGFRAPGGDGAWGAVFNPRQGFESLTGVYAARNPGNANLPYVSDPSGGSSANNTLVRGRIFGPYLELKDENLLGGLRPDGSISRPEDPDYDIRPKVILDYWGTPIRYYRNPYNGGDPAAVTRSLDLSDVFALRPWSFEEGVLVEGVADANGDRSSSSQLQSGEFALMSLGADRRETPGTRVDESEFNRDNIVEIGP
ncbi:MAG: hypothetical protein CMJ34_04110 [Phycisphaerae bacterium]|nr:hypothetical protein [Phycisphaerae bacterium]